MVNSCRKFCKDTKKETLYEIPEINLIWTDCGVQLLLESVSYLKHRKYAEVRPCLIQQLFAFFLKHTSLFLHQMQNFFLLPKLGTSLAYNHS